VSTHGVPVYIISYKYVQQVKKNNNNNMSDIFYHCAHTVSRVSSRFDWQSVSPGGTTPSHVVPSALHSRHVHGVYTNTGLGRGGVLTPSRQHRV